MSAVVLALGLDWDWWLYFQGGSSWFIPLDLSTHKCPHSMAAGLPQSEQLQRPLQKLNAFPYLALTVTLYDSCRVLLVTQPSPYSMSEEHLRHKNVAPGGKDPWAPAGRLATTLAKRSAIISHLLLLREESCCMFF